MNTQAFNSVKLQKPKRNHFDLSHERKFSFNMGQLTPILVQEVVPGDKFTVQNEQLLRFAPMLAPIMHQVNVYTHYFFVPNRIVWDNWDEFITGSIDVPPPAFPTIRIEASAGGVHKVKDGSLADYLGLPTGQNNQTYDVNAIPFAAFSKIYNEYYRDQNLCGEREDTLRDGNWNEAIKLQSLEKPPLRAFEHDYFTSALPWTQKGEDVHLTFDTDTNVPVSYSQDLADANGPDTYYGISPDGGGTNLMYGMYDGTEGGVNEYTATLAPQPDGTTFPVNMFPRGLEVDLQGTYLMTINELRQGFAIQRWLELNARAGSRYIETILAHFGVQSSDARLQRPEYLGGGKSNVAISEVLQQSQSDTTPQGTMAGHGINYGTSHEFTRFFEEHGYIIGIMSVMPTTSYQQGIPRHFLKNDKLDFYWPAFAHLGEQEIKNVELYLNAEQRDGTFGYIPRYSEYKFINSSVHGDFRNQLDFWHLGRKFSTEPVLNSEFIQCNPQYLERIFAVTDDNVHHLWCHLYQKVWAKRPIPVYSTPI